MSSFRFCLAFKQSFKVSQKFSLLLEISVTREKLSYRFIMDSEIIFLIRFLWASSPYRQPSQRLALKRVRISSLCAIANYFMLFNKYLNPYSLRRNGLRGLMLKPSLS